VLYDPGRTDTSGPYDVPTRPPSRPCRRLSRVVLSRLNSTALALAVYASQWSLLAPTQDSLPAAGQALPGGIGYPQGSDERFQTVFLLLSQVFLAQGRITQRLVGGIANKAGPRPFVCRLMARSGAFPELPNRSFFCLKVDMRCMASIDCFVFGTGGCPRVSETNCRKGGIRSGLWSDIRFRIFSSQEHWPGICAAAGRTRI